MKRLLTTLLAIAVLMPLVAQARNVVPRKVQGVDYVPRQAANGEIMTMSDDGWGDFPVPDDMPAPDGEFTFDMIKSWTGEGSNRAALVIQWNDEKEQNALVFGYRWEGQATGADMIRAVVAANPRLYTLIQYTNVSSPTDPLGGYTINGFGWDSDSDGDIALIDTKDNTVYEVENGLFIHPRGYVPGQGGSSDYDYDDWIARDTDDFWGAGWYLSYWSYWVKDDYASAFSYSGWGASGRVLTDGSWDGWNFSLNMVPRDWKMFIAAPALIPEGAKTEFEYQGLCYTLSDYSKKSVKLVAPAEGVAQYAGVINVPSSFVDEDITYNVTEIAPNAFENSEVTDVNLPKQITKIGVAAFKNSTLRSLTVDGVESYETLSSIGAEAFYGCSSLSTLVLSPNATAVPEGAFAGTAISGIAFSDKIETVGAYAFEGCASLTSIDIPSTLKSIGSLAFAGCDALQSVKISSTYPLAITPDVFSSKAYADAQLSVPVGYENIFAAAPAWGEFAHIGGQLIAVNVGDMFMYGGVTYQVLSIEDSTVKATYCKVDGKPTAALIKAANQAGYSGAVTVPASVDFQNRKFAVVELNDSAFYEANKLTSVVIEANVPKIGRYTFYDCTKLEAVTLPASIRSIGTYAFSYAGVTSLQLPAEVNELGDRAFFQCTAMQSVNLPDSVTAIPTSCFSYCKALTSMSIHDRVTTIASNAFENCAALTSVTLPKGMTFIPASMFKNCSSLQQLDIPESVTEIKSSAFYGCSQLQIKLPASVTTFGTEAFRGCSMLTEFTFPESVTSVPNSIFYDCVNLQSVVLSSKTATIGSSSFRNCKSLKSIALPSSLTSIGSYGFAGCIAMEEITIPEGVTTVNTYAFDGCTALSKITLPTTLKTLGGYSLRKTAIKELVIPASCTSLTGADIVNGCSDVTVYSLNPNPGTCGTYSWRISGSIFAPIVVPTGKVDAYTAKNYWKKSSLSAPSVTGVQIGDLKAGFTEDWSREVVVSGSLSLAYDMDSLPAAFARANDAMILQNVSAAIAVGDTTVTVQVNAADGSFSAVVPCVQGAVACSLTLNDGDKSYVSSAVDLAMPIYVEPSVVDSYVDFSQIGYTVGNGEKTGALMISWNDEERGVDHLVWGVRFNPGTTAEELIDSVVAADSRLYRLDNGGYAYDNMDKGSIHELYDHYSGDMTAGRWKVYSDSTLLNKSVVYLTFEPDSVNTPQVPDYTFYIPEEEFLGGLIPENYKCPIADNMVFPVWCRVGGYGYDYCSVSLNPSRPFVENNKGEIKSKRQEGYSMITLELSKTEFNQGPDKETYYWEPSCYDTKVTVSVWPEKHQLDESDSYHLTLCADTIGRNMSIVEPLRPITHINDTMINVMGKLPYTALRDLVDYEPKDATYTQFILVDYATRNRLDVSEGRVGGPYGEFATGYDAWLEQIQVGAGATDGMFEVSPRMNPEIVGLLGFSVNPYPVTAVYLDGLTDEDTIELEQHEILALSPKVEPEQAMNQNVVLKLANASAENMAVTYPVGGSRKFTELVTYASGEFDLVLTSAENSAITRTYHVIVKPLDKVVSADEYTDGTFWLNEEWFTHKNGSINYLTSPVPQDDSEIIYRAYGRCNDDMGFGATSQFGMIFADKLFVMSKQDNDAGDLRGVAGGRLVIADAHSLKHLASFDEIGGDGRACVGVSSEKAYVGTNAGIRVLHMYADGSFELEDSNIKGINNETEGGSSDIGSNQALYNKQIGDMVSAGNYVFAIQQGVGVHVIDATSDEVVKLIADEAVQGIVQDASGLVWYASLNGVESGTTDLHAIDPATLDELRVVNVPGTIGCGWGAWRSTNFFASKSQPVLFWNGSASSIDASGRTFFRWDTTEDPASIAPLMSLPSLPGVESDTKQTPYATMRYDDRSDMILMATTTSPSGNYRYNWYNFINASTGEIEHSVRLKDYYWFPALPIFPDKYAPEFGELDPVVIMIPLGEDSHSITFEVPVTDADNIDYNISVVAEESDQLAGIADVTVEGRRVTVNGVAEGKSDLTLMAESNGLVSTVTVPVTVAREVDGVEAVDSLGGRVYINGRRINVRDMEGIEFLVFDVAGRAVAGFIADSDDVDVRLTVSSGAYVLTTADGSRSFKFIVR